jgi:HSP20 family protein
MDDLPDSTFAREDPIRIDVREAEEAWIVRAEIPGVEPSALDVQLVGDVLTLSGEKKPDETRERNGSSYSERRYGAFRRSIRLTSPVDAQKVSAEHKNGVVTITLPKAESTRPRRIEVRSAS